MSKLVIVESPSKAKTIQKYLGPDYKVVASMGHVRDLPKARLCVDVKDKFRPKYTIIKGKEQLVKDLKAEAQKADGVLLATDPDREGEAISWHLAYILDLEEDAPDRVTFNEITKTGVAEGMAHPRTIDMDLVNAQQARRILDRLVGYTLSPFLVKTIRKGLSAGRVQSVAVRMIVDREEEIRAFVPKEYWSLDAKLTAPPARSVFQAAFFGDRNGEIEINSKEQADKILAELEGQDFVVGPVKKGRRSRQPAPPFITSTLQQEASRKLGFQAYRTMRAAQELYEGVDIEGQGAVGLITYMRTDSLRISEDAIREAGEFIDGRWGGKYLPPKPRRYKSRAGAQDGHEAIRPSTISLTPEKVKSSLTPDQYKLYKLIWERFIASQMANCVLNTTQANILAGTISSRPAASTWPLRASPPCMRRARTSRRRRARICPRWRRARSSSSGSSQATSTLPSPRPGTRRPPLSRPWRRTALAAPQPTRPLSPPSPCGSMWPGRARPLSPPSWGRSSPS